MINILEYINMSKPLQRFLRRFLLCMSTAEAEKLFLVGGMVRDSIIKSLNQDNPTQLYGININKSNNQTDIDLMAANISYGALGTILKKLMLDSELGIYKVIDVGRLFPVYKVYARWADEPIDVALARSETSHGPGHSEFSVQTESVTARDDASRRDFTVNAIFLRLSLAHGNANNSINGELVDYFGGIASIRQKEIKAILSPGKRFSEDPLRMLRAIRQKVQLGYTIERETSESILKLIPKYLLTISKERVVLEVFKTLSASPRQGLYDLRAFGVFKILLPEIHALPGASWERMCKRTELLSKPSQSLIFASILLEPCIERAEELKAEANIGSKINYICQSANIGARMSGIPNAAKSLTVNLIKILQIDKCDYPLVTIENICRKTPECLALYNAHQRACGISSEAFNKKTEKILKTPKITTGKDLIKSGIKPGRHMTPILSEIREKELRGEIKSAQNGAAFAHDCLVLPIYHSRD